MCPISPHRLRPCLALLVSAALVPAAFAQDGIQVFTSGAHFFKRVVTNTNPQTTSREEFGPLPGASTTIFVPGRTVVLVNAGFSAETRCSGGQGDNWCELSITIGGAEGSPQASTFAPDTFAVDSTDGGTEGVGSWESHAFTRHRCIRNEGTAPLAVPVAVNWKVTNFGMPPVFWVDDSALVVEMSRECRVDQLPANAPPRQPGGAPTVDQQ